MRSNDKQKSIKLREQGLSVKDIALKIGAAKGSVSTWVRNVVLTSEQKLALKRKIHSPEVIERRRNSRLKNEADKKALVINKAASLIKKMTKKDLQMIGLALYWGEGAKSNKGMARISNSDPALVMMCMRFFREICGVKEDRFRGHIHIHSASSARKAEEYWSRITGVPTSQFFKTYVIKSKSSKNLRFTLPYGTLDIGVGDTNLLLRILGSIDGLKRQSTK